MIMLQLATLYLHLSNTDSWNMVTAGLVWLRLYTFHQFIKRLPLGYSEPSDCRGRSEILTLASLLLFYQRVQHIKHQDLPTALLLLLLLLSQDGLNHLFIQVKNLYRPKLAKQSREKLVPQAYRVAAGNVVVVNKMNPLALKVVSADAGIVNRFLCWFQPSTTVLLRWLRLSLDIFF